MSLMIEDEATLATIKRLTEKTGRSVEEVVRSAVEAAAAQANHQELERPGTVSPAERARRRAVTREIQKEFASWPKTGLKADKAFFDSLNDDL